MPLPASRARRSLFQRSVASMLRPPWSSEDRIREGCTSCGDCLSACPEAILVPGPAGTPKVSFASGACLFCKDCVDACPEAETVFDLSDSTPWSAQGERLAVIQDSCLLQSGVTCQLCTDSCETQALRMDLSVRPFGRLVLEADKCTACGACVEPCPVGAMTIALAPTPATTDTGTEHV